MQRPQQNPGDHFTPPPFGPTSSRSAFSADVVSEHPCFTLREWWLERVEGHERKIAVGGFFERNQAVLDFPAAPIAKRHESYVLETENGTVVFIYGPFNIKRTLGNGFTIEACEKFSCGFPHWWESWILYPNMMSSQRESQPRSSETSNSREDISRFYFERLQEGKLLDWLARRVYNAEAFSGNSDAFPDSSHLPNGAPRFEEYPCDDEGTNDEGHPKPTVASLKRRGCLKKPQSVALSESILGEDTPAIHCADVESSEKGEQPVSSRKQRSAFRKSQHARRSPNIMRPVPYGNPSPVTNGWSKFSSVSVSTPESLKLKKTRSGRVVVPPLDPGCQSIVYDHDGSISAIISIDSPPQIKE